MSEYVVRFLTVRSLDQRGECWFAFERDGLEHRACIAETRLRRIVTQLRYHQVEEMPRFSWRGKRRSYYLQVLDDLERVASTGRDMYPELMLPGPLIGDRQHPLFRPFIRDGWYDHNGEPTPDPFQAINPIDYEPQYRFIATAAIVEQTPEGFQVADWVILREATDEQVSVPAVGWIIEGSNFWSGILNHPDRYQDHVFKTSKKGKSADRTYTHTACCPPGPSANFEPSHYGRASREASTKADGRDRGGADRRGS